MLPAYKAVARKPLKMADYRGEGNSHAFPWIGEENEEVRCVTSHHPLWLRHCQPITNNVVLTVCIFRKCVHEHL